MIRCFINIFGLLFLIVVISSCSKSNEKITIIPEPYQIKPLIGNFEFTDSTAVIYSNEQEESIARFLCQELKDLYNLNVSAQSSSETKENSGKLIISLGYCHDDVGGEGYLLKIEGEEIYICANMQVGLFYGIQSLLQLFPVDNDTVFKLPCVEIIDKPEFYWRGVQLDVATHFFDKETLKEFIDVLAMHKINKLQLQLANDYGWRVEIKKYPKLTEVGAWREDRRNEPWSILESQRPDYPTGKPKYGGFYTHEDIKEIVEYAQKRFITIVPQIQLPSNVTSILTAYPELSCSGEKQRITIGRNRIGNNAICIGNDSSIVFFENVIDELIELFPHSSIYIDGYNFSTSWKNCEKCQAKKERLSLKSDQDLLKSFVGDIESYILSRGRSIVGSESMLFQKLVAGAVITLQRNDGVIKQISEQGHRVVCSPVDKYLFSSYQDDPSQEFPAYPNVISLKDVYLSNPIPGNISKDDYSNVLGIQSLLFTDFIQTQEMLEYMAFPRMCAFSERAWSNPESKDWERFENKMSDHYYRLDKVDLNYYVPPPLGLKDEVIYDEAVKIKLSSDNNEVKIHYTLDGTLPNIESPIYIAPIIISETSTLKAKSFLPNGRSSNIRVARFTKTAAQESLTEIVNMYSGIQFTYYKGFFREVSEIYNTQAVFTRVTNKIGIPDNIYLENFALVLDGIIYVEKEGIYSFYISSDDGSKLYLGGELLIDNDGIHGPDWIEGQVALKAGYHAIKIEYFDLNLNETLKVEYEGPGITRKEIPEKIIFYMNVTEDEFAF